MARKTKKAFEKVNEINDKIKEIQQQAELARKEAEEAEVEDRKHIEDIREKINTIAEEEGMYCGVILSFKDVLTLVEAVMNGEKKIQLPFNLYFKE